ncbi:MAG: bifunctional ADP-heptose synthase [Haliscomenobacter sp.]|uniref:bifunctional heptose 7-phosphate kinase/heptose 1-phosphate adenyltransferase n=1 Tax=Haliscomenobacter sp. TaxID=2717303 RepID=UPI0029B92782|nr:bifunctional ADP-heptose synthase [Haliscomenobacter sp.]MDX2068904.1 bifunctional ADP-heptose synthase [Haliscomenobacter sp.]
MLNFDDFNQVNVLIVGDVMIDRYLRGNVTRISPEAPVPVVNLEAEDLRLGGAANVALNVRAMGATPILCSVVGHDEDGQAFRQLLPENGMSNQHILHSSTRRTTVKTRIMAGAQHLLRMDQEDTHDLNDSEVEQLLEIISYALDTQDIHVILFQDYNKGVLSPRVIREVILESIRRGIPTAVDPKFNNFWAYKQITLFKPNLKEIRAQSPQPVQTNLASLQAAATYIKAQLGNQHTLITLSEKGLFLETGGKGKIIPTEPRAVADVCGAGDTVISIVALGLGLKLDLQEIALLANLAGGQVCEKVGVVPVDKEQLGLEYLKIKGYEL